jgi:hypothetical protein
MRKMKKKKEKRKLLLGEKIGIGLIILFLIFIVVRSIWNPNNSSSNTTSSSQHTEIITKEEAAKRADENKKKLEESLANLKNNAETIPYKTLYRDIESNKSKSVHYKGKVIQVISGILPSYRVNITQDQYGYWDDTVLVNDAGTDLEKHPKILENDIVEFWGFVRGETSYQTVLGATVSLPEINASIIELVK